MQERNEAKFVVSFKKNHTMNLVEISIKRPILIIVLFLVLGLLGTFSYTQLRYELLPNISTPIVSISTIWGGASPTEIEKGITKKIEGKVSTVEKIKRITAQSSENVSVVTIEFVQDANSNGTILNRRVFLNSGSFRFLPSFFSFFSVILSLLLLDFDGSCPIETSIGGCVSVSFILFYFLILSSSVVY
jgi:AcrB/AcrD/AcrF family